MVWARYAIKLWDFPAPNLWPSNLPDLNEVYTCIVLFYAWPTPRAIVPIDTVMRQVCSAEANVDWVEIVLDHDIIALAIHQQRLCQRCWVDSIGTFTVYGSMFIVLKLILAKLLFLLCVQNYVTHSNTVFIKECDKRTNSKEQNKKPNRI